jgi:hypothetical protein
MEMSGCLHVSAALSTMKDLRYLVDSRLRGLRAGVKVEGRHRSLSSSGGNQTPIYKLSNQ